MDFRSEAKTYVDPDKMADEYLAVYFANQKIEYPINPFQMLKNEGILFTMSNFQRLEGVYIPETAADGVPVVGINVNRPITRQRFTAAHELCHHFRDADKQISCPIGRKNDIEKFADRFAAAILMPMQELSFQVDKRKNDQGIISFDDVLEIADFFGVSFQSCLYRIAYCIHAIDGNTEPDELKSRIKKYQPDKKRRQRQMSYADLYEGLIDNLHEQLRFIPTDHARFLFQNEYIYNDSRMEGLDVSLKQASEIVTDLRLKMQNSVYCKEDEEVFMSIAGHYMMYQDIFQKPVKDSVSIYDTFLLNKKLFSCYPYPDYGGNIRQDNTLVLGAKFETVDHCDIYVELNKVDIEIKEMHVRRNEMTDSEFIKHIIRVHHAITRIHPFPDGNGRTARAFMNLQLVRSGLPPVYIKAEDKSSYIDALSMADNEGRYEDLYEIIFRLILKSHATLTGA